MALRSKSRQEQAYLKAYRAAQAADARFSKALQREYKSLAGTVRYQPDKQSPAIRALGAAYRKTAEAMGKALAEMRKVGGSVANRRKPKNPARLERCVRAVKKKGGAVSPYAVCKAQMKKGNSSAQKQAKKRFLASRENPELKRLKSLDAIEKYVAAAKPTKLLYLQLGNKALKAFPSSPYQKRLHELAEQVKAKLPRENTRARVNPRGGFSVVQGKASADVAPSGQDWVVRIKGDKPKEFKSVEAAAKYARLRVHETAPATRNPYRPGKRKIKVTNPQETAERMYHIFHGKPATQVLEFVQREHVHEWLWAAGTLVSMVVVNGSQQMTLCAPDPEESDPEDVVMVGFSEDGRQAYFVGGDQDIDLDALMEKFSMNEDDIRDHMKLGQVKKLTYQTSKSFEERGKVDIDFYHALGKEHSKGVFPDLVFKPLNPSMELVGGRYFVAPKDSQLGASPGVVG